LNEDSCIGCGSCVAIYPEIFELAGEVAVVKSGADLSSDDKSIETGEVCPVEAIIKKNGFKRSRSVKPYFHNLDFRIARDEARAY